MRCDSVVLAAGLGTRMRSSLPKAFHRLGGRELLVWVEAACREATGRAPVIVIGPEMEKARELLPPDVTFVVQQERLGTGHALLQAGKALRDAGDSVLVTTADMALLTAKSLRSIVEQQAAHAGALSMLTVVAPEPRGFGRIVRAKNGQVARVVEEAEATQDELRISELNASVYCYRSAWLWDHLKRLTPSSTGEIYLTDLIGLAADEGQPIASLALSDPDEAIGINTREHLAEAESILRRRVNRAWMVEGVTITDPATTYIEPGVMLGRDTLLLPNTHLEGATSIGEGCVVGPNSVIRDSIVGNRCTIEASFAERAELEDDVRVGPFAHLRPGARLLKGVHMGNFGEVKNSTLGPGVKMGHFSYVGDAAIGADTNVGAGTITCNFSRDGQKHRTEVGRGAFLGSDTLLVAPVRVGEGASTGAGSVVTRDVPDQALAVGMPARVIRSRPANA